MTSQPRTPVEWKNEQTLEARALYALWRNHPLTAVKDRWGERAHRLARANRNMLLSWAATQPDYRLRDCRNIGAATLAWIRANEPTGYMALVTYGTGENDRRRLRDWWDSLNELDQFNAYRIEKSNADALAAPDPAPLDVAWEALAADIHANGYSVRDAIAVHRPAIAREYAKEPQP